MRSTKSMSLAAGLYHISNAGPGELDPGFNAHLFYIGYLGSK